MSKIEVGEYMRTKEWEIHKVIKIIEDDGDWDYYCCENNSGYFAMDIVNHSKQPIDLIEVKDLVCFKNKLQNSLENEEMIIHIFDNDTLEEVKQAIKKGEIELLEILTHEQFEANCYKVGGEE